MPRPGPRPYECVRRAWHSDKHQPIRGSLIQEIFRVVNEIHSPATKKNKEWQEKLPVVVLKAEEIMYSKANSEAEYMDPKTLLDRTNDAINTIIRRDENLETGDLLQPCIEAALNLGCTPTRASRGQHNGNVRFYLSPATQEPNSSSPGLARNTIQANHVNNLKRVPDSNFKRSPITNPTHLGSESKNLVSRNVDFNLSSLCSVYPLHRASCVEPHHGLPNPGSTEPVKIGRTRNFFCCQEEPPVKISRITLADSPSNPKQIECDLPLQLGFSSAPLPGVKGTNLQEVESVDYDCSQRGSKLNNA